MQLHLYAQIEKELLTIVFVMERFENYVYGKHVTVESDHKRVKKNGGPFEVKFGLFCRIYAVKGKEISIFLQI